MAHASTFPPQTLRRYALLADGERGALIGPEGEVAFLCAPRWHDDPVFSSLLGGRGCYAVTPRDERFVWGGHYDDGTLIWRSRWVTTDAIIECREALAFPGEEGSLVLLRRVEAVRGDAAVRVGMDCRAGFGREPMDVSRDGDTWVGRTGGLRLRWSGAPDDVGRSEDGLTGTLLVPEGGFHDLVLEISAAELGTVPANAARLWRDTEAAWSAAVPELGDALAAADVRHSYAVLRGLTNLRTGGMVAAATTSLPERAAQGRNYDYRYVWIRDQCYAGQAAAAIGGTALVDAAVTFVGDRLREDGSRLKPAYTVDGGAVPEERRAGVPGYPGGSDLVGNRATAQFQLDAFGEALLLFACAQKVGRLGPSGWEAARIAARAIEQRKDDVEAGIWELDDRRWTHSRLICAAGLKAMARRRPGDDTAGWEKLADALVAEALEECVHSSGRWQRSASDDRVDAALLLPALRGALPPEHPVSVATWRAVRDELGRDGYVFRYRHGDLPLGDAEGAFLLCGFQMALATQQQGRPWEAVRWFERNRAARGTPRLFSEEYDVTQSQLRGNLPQAFVHAMFIEAAVGLADEARSAGDTHDRERGGT